MKRPKWWKRGDWYALVWFLAMFIFFAKFSTDGGSLREGAIIIAIDLMWRVMAGSWVRPAKQSN